MPDDFCNPAGIVGKLSDRIRDFMRQHGLTLAMMGDHAGVSQHTLKAIVANNRKPHPKNLQRLEEALQREPPPPPPRPLAHADVVRDYWGRESSEKIGKRVGITGARVRAIAKAIRITGDQDAAASTQER